MKPYLSELLSVPINEVNVDSDWRHYFYAEGLTDAYTNSLSSLWYKWLGSQGYTNRSLRQRFYSWYTSSGSK